MQPTVEGSTVLVVDDDEAIRTFVRQCLAPLGVQVVEAEHESGAVERIAERRPDLILLDLMLPDGSGIDVCERLQGLGLSDIPVLVVSARRLPQDRALAAAMGVAAYLTKPLSRGSLVAQVHALLLARTTREEAGVRTIFQAR